ncbi:zinc ribbon domain-containing protein [Halorhabdus sp. CBA1104]|uniref:zinc ribbon domain-containing protein n=1 Tax=Halorhabdus sp. CBA1104 TaxID=1380432 RepID=UPI0012B337B5|nr:zinc ribbon domain-containing protein [Halorhabdus sp. CBA1104]QGN06129.1 zinc ribbon domain-containing protein [Halorhabdus sp. CBA1104]
MRECPYCGADAEAGARYCDRCGERLVFEGDDRDGFLGRTSVQYLQGVRHGARPLDPSTGYHENLRAELTAAIEDFSHLASVGELQLSEVLDVDDAQFQALEDDISPDTDLRPATRRALGVAVLVALLEETYDGPMLDELQVLASDVE